MSALRLIVYLVLASVTSALLGHSSGYRSGLRDAPETVAARERLDAELDAIECQWAEESRDEALAACQKSFDIAKDYLVSNGDLIDPEQEDLMEMDRYEGNDQEYEPSLP